jgi:hypothetical protein
MSGSGAKRMSEFLAMLGLSPAALKPHMAPDEFEVFARLYRAASRIVEFGAGGSTVFAAAETGASIVTVESDSAWIAKLSRQKAVRKAEDEGRLRLIHVDIGPTGKWGHPVDNSAMDRWPLYPEAPWTLTEAPDLVFIDGRFRRACMLASIRNAPDATVMVHDFWGRPAYHSALDFFEVEERAGSLAVLRAKEATATSVAEAMAAAQFEPA